MYESTRIGYANYIRFDPNLNLTTRLGYRCRYAANEMVIVDLYSQRDAVAAQLRLIEAARKLDWLRERGELIEIPMSCPSPPTFKFRSNEGIETGFVIRDGMMIFIGDHTSAGAVQIEQ